MLNSVLLVLVFVPAVLLALYCLAMLFLAVQRVLIWCYEVTLGLGHSWRDSFQAVGDRAAQRQRQRYWEGVLKPPKRSGRPDKGQVRRFEHAQYADHGLKVLREHMGACCFAHHITARALGKRMMEALRNRPDCAAARYRVVELLSIVQGLHKEEELGTHAGLAKNAVVLGIIPEFCGENCHLLGCAVDEASNPCTPARLLGWRPDGQAKADESADVA